MVYWTGLALSAALALVLVPAGVRGLRRAGHVRTNYRDAEVAFPLGGVLVTVSLVALAPLAFLDDRLGLSLLDPDLRRWIAFVLGIAFLGLLDDALGRGAAADTARGWRGHLAAAMRGELSTGLIKAIGALALAAYVVSGTGRESLGFLADVLLLIVVTNVFNLLDTGPGRAEKALLITIALIVVGSWSLATIALLGVFLGPILIGFGQTIRERAMLGDTGSNLVGALCAVSLLVTLDEVGRLIALVIALIITVYGEFRSISTLIGRVPPLRALDSIGRHHPPVQAKETAS